MVVLRVDEVDRRPGQLHPRFEDGFVNAVSVEALATEGRDQGGVDVHRAAVELAARLERRQEAQEQNQVHVVVSERGVEGVVEGADFRVLLAHHGDGGDPPATGALQAEGLLLRSDHDLHAPRDRTRIDVLEQVLEARSRAREQHRDAQRGQGHLHSRFR